VESRTDFIYDCKARGYYVAKVDVTAAQSAESNQKVREFEKRSIMVENQLLALRMAAARTICRAAKNFI